MRKEFRVSENLQKQHVIVIVLAILMGTLGLGLGLLFDNLNPVVKGLLILLGLLQFFWAWITASIVKTVRLVTTSETIEFYSPGLELSTTWDNLERIGRMTAKAAQYDSLVLRNPAKQKTSTLFRLFRRQQEKEIPLSMFSNWRTSEMGQEIKKSAPHLFSDGGASK